MGKEREKFIDKIVDLCHYMNVDSVSLNEIRYIGENHGYPEYAPNHIKGYDVFEKLGVIEYKTSEELITKGCVDDFKYREIDFRIKRLCGYKLKPTEQTFKVIYSNGEKFDDWISQDKHNEMEKIKILSRWIYE